MNTLGSLFLSCAPDKQTNIQTDGLERYTHAQFRPSVRACARVCVCVCIYGDKEYLVIGHVLRDCFVYT